MNKAYSIYKNRVKVKCDIQAFKIQMRQNDHLSISSAYECLLAELCKDGLEVSIVHFIRLTIEDCIMQNDYISHRLLMKQ